MVIDRSSNTDQAEDHPLSVQELEQVEGIGHKTAQALFEMGLRNYAGLAYYLERTPAEEIARDLQERGVNIKSGLIQKEKMLTSIHNLSITQAIAATEAGREAEPPQEAIAEMPPSELPEITAQFTISFGWATQPDGSRQLLTTVYDERNFGKEVVFQGRDPQPWVDWILEHANIQTGQENLPDVEHIHANAEPVVEAVLPEDLEVLSIDVFEPEPMAGKPGSTLIADVQFQLSPAQLDYLISEARPCQVSVYLHDLASDTLQLISAGNQELIPGKTHCQYQVEFPIPNLGRYTIQTKFFMPEPKSTAWFAIYDGQPFTVSPYIPQFAGQAA
ncbi:MAG: hypothetical protein MUC85_09515 [Anaerolineales bacterium]|jgi:hypothetical protein|nr:hypothetical protein [Anaerolineales bacterium]